jgi:hypothetical protein
MKNVAKQRAGIKTHQNRTGIHALSPEEKKAASEKGKKAFLDKWQIPEYKELHQMKIRYGKVKARFDKLEHPMENEFKF